VPHFGTPASQSMVGWNPSNPYQWIRPSGTYLGLINLKTIKENFMCRSLMIRGKGGA